MLALPTNLLICYSNKQPSLISILIRIMPNNFIIHFSNRYKYGQNCDCLDNYLFQIILFWIQELKEEHSLIPRKEIYSRNIYRLAFL